MKRVLFTFRSRSKDYRRLLRKGERLYILGYEGVDSRQAGLTNEQEMLQLLSQKADEYLSSQM